jgi:hypothetical protein
VCVYLCVHYGRFNCLVVSNYYYYYYYYYLLRYGHCDTSLFSKHMFLNCVTSFSPFSALVRDRRLLIIVEIKSFSIICVIAVYLIILSMVLQAYIFGDCPSLFIQIRINKFREYKTFLATL